MNSVEITLFLFNVLLIVVIITAYVQLTHLVKNQGVQIQLLLKHEKEGFSPAQRWGMAAAYAAKPNGLMPEGKSGAAAGYGSKTHVPIQTSERGDRPFSYMLPTPTGAAEVVDEAVDEAVVETPAATALNVTQEDLMKSGANAIAVSAIEEKEVPDTSALPATVQSGVVQDDVAETAVGKEGFCSSNTRVCPLLVSNNQFHVSNKNQKGGISTSKDGFRPRGRYA